MKLPEPLQEYVDPCKYYHTDVLGSVRAVTNAAGTTTAMHDYKAFGEGNTQMTGDPRRFTGKERDAETGFDYFDARYYRNMWGRFTTIDPGQASGSVEDPQGWNAYAYSRNNPLRYTDPDGREYQLCYANTCVDGIKDRVWSQISANPGPGIRFGAGSGPFAGTIEVLYGAHWVEFGTYLWIGPDETTPGALGYLLNATASRAEAGVRQGLRDMAVGAAGSLIGLGAGLAVDFVIAKLAVPPVADAILVGNRVGAGLKADKFHRAASFLTRNQLKAGRVFSHRSGDGARMTLLQTPGKVNGESGIFEFLIHPNGTVPHQRFIPGGRITGHPNQWVPR